MTISNIFNLVQSANPHQYPNSDLLSWMTTCEKDIDEYMRHVYTEFDADEEAMAESDFDDLSVTDETLIEEPQIYVEWLCHKIDFYNGEYERANNHLALYQGYLNNWKERYFRGHKNEVSNMPDYITGIL